MWVASLLGRDIARRNRMILRFCQFSRRGPWTFSFSSISANPSFHKFSTISRVPGVAAWKFLRFTYPFERGIARRNPSFSTVFRPRGRGNHEFSSMSVCYFNSRILWIWIAFPFDQGVTRRNPMIFLRPGGRANFHFPRIWSGPIAMDFPWFLAFPASQRKNSWIWWIWAPLPV